MQMTLLSGAARNIYLLPTGDCSMPEPIQAHAAVPCRERRKFPTILMRLPGIERKAAQSDPERRFITLEHISANYPEEERTQVLL